MSRARTRSVGPTAAPPAADPHVGGDRISPAELRALCVVAREMGVSDLAIEGGNVRVRLIEGIVARTAKTDDGGPLKPLHRTLNTSDDDRQDEIDQFAHVPQLHVIRP